MVDSLSEMNVFCPECGQKNRFTPRDFRCDCGGAWEPIEGQLLSVTEIDLTLSSIWRYQKWFGLPLIAQPVSLGAGWTPLLEVDWHGKNVHVKMEYMAPTGSFKDRGTELEMNFLSAFGVRDVVEDSSGNAGASLAAYAARLGLQADIYVPQSASPSKLKQIQMFGAQLNTIPGLRMEATIAAIRAVEQGAVYASHAYNPVYLLGLQSFAWEVWEQLADAMPQAVVIPVGQGGLLMGAWLGFRRLLQSGLVQFLPRLFAVQPERFAPIANAYQAGMDEIPTIEPIEASVAEGLAISRPVRARRIMQALRESNGTCLTVSENEIHRARGDLAARGFFVEPTSAVAAAALPQILDLTRDSEVVVLALTGSGLKSL